MPIELQEDKYYPTCLYWEMLKQPQRNIFSVRSQGKRKKMCRLNTNIISNWRINIWTITEVSSTLPWAVTTRIQNQHAWWVAPSSCPRQRWWAVVQSSVDPSLMTLSSCFMRLYKAYSTHNILWQRLPWVWVPWRDTFSCLVWATTSYHHCKPSSPWTRRKSFLFYFLLDIYNVIDLCVLSRFSILKKPS